MKENSSRPVGEFFETSNGLRVSDVYSTISSGSRPLRVAITRNSRSAASHPSVGRQSRLGTGANTGSLWSQTSRKTRLFSFLWAGSGCLRRSRPSLARLVRAKRVGERRTSDREGTHGAFVGGVRSERYAALDTILYGSPSRSIAKMTHSTRRATATIAFFLEPVLAQSFLNRVLQ